MAQDRAAHADVLLDVEQRVARHVGSAEPEAHHLHQAPRVGPRYRETLKAALHVDHREHHFRRQADAGGLAMHVHEDLDPFLRVGHAAGEAARHVGEPDLGLEAVGEAVGLGDGGCQLRLQLGIETFAVLFPGRRLSGGGRNGDDEERRQCDGEPDAAADVSPAALSAARG